MDSLSLNNPCKEGAIDPPTGTFELATYALTGILAFFGLTLIVLLVVSCFTNKAEVPKLAGGSTAAVAAALRAAPQQGGATPGWGPTGFLFPKSWVYIWWGYLAMLVTTGIVVPRIITMMQKSLGYCDPSGEVMAPPAWVEAVQGVIGLAPFLHCFLMPFLWVHKHREEKRRIEKQASAVDLVQTTELDPEAKTVIFSSKHGCGTKLKIGLVDLCIGLVDLILWLVRKLSLGTINLSAFWFPAPFYNFWKAKYAGLKLSPLHPRAQHAALLLHSTSLTPSPSKSGCTSTCSRSTAPRSARLPPRATPT